MNRLAGKRALITGGTSGIGLETAQRFIAEGADVLVTGVTPASIDRARQILGEKVPVVQADARDLDAQRGLAKQLIFTGGFGNGARYSESQVARSYALKRGVPPQAILIETESRTTRQNLQQAAALMKAHKFKRALIVSDPLHMARALRLARGMGIDALGSSTPTSRFRSFETRKRFLLQEVYFFHRDLFVESR